MSRHRFLKSSDGMIHIKGIEHANKWIAELRKHCDFMSGNGIAELKDTKWDEWLYLNEILTLYRNYPKPSSLRKALQAKDGDAAKTNRRL